MNDRARDRAPDTDPVPGPESGAEAAITDAADLDVEGHSATIYRRRRGPYPLRHGVAPADADERTRGERQPLGGRAVR